MQGPLKDAVLAASDEIARWLSRDAAALPSFEPAGEKPEGTRHARRRFESA
jgi:hypothetical protein